ncbi:MAG: N-acetyl-alpha-D-glucosaminyl L-malate synthase BshA [Bacteroidetes bacterium]|nr:MAG: N-acetyl-alpha-D-glucosaminyl L-malate synthase BshA [Bacteroidota bacterium]
MADCNCKIRIGIVLYPTFGGSGVVATELGKYLADKGHEVHFITYSQPVRLAHFTKNIFYHEVAVSNYPLFDYEPYETVLASKIVDVVQHEKLNVLHVHYAIPHASAAFMAQQILESKGIQIPFVTTLHGTDITLVGRDSSFEPVISFCINKSNAVTAVSESLKQDTYRHFNTDREIQVIPNFIQAPNELPKVDMEMRRRYAEDNEPVFCHISNFRKVKRVKDVLKVFYHVNMIKSSKLLLVGDGPERHKVEELCREYELCDKVTFVGKVRDTNDVLAISDIFLLTSETESFGLAALEALAMGVPVISTNTGGIPEVNQHGVSGFLSDVGDVQDMAKNALEILKDEQQHLRFRLGALNVARKFDIGDIVCQYEKLYLSLIE